MVQKRMLRILKSFQRKAPTKAMREMFASWVLDGKQLNIYCQDGSALTQVASMLNACLPNPILYCCFQNVDFYVC
jgi:hypothetical protein